MEHLVAVFVSRAELAMIAIACGTAVELAFGERASWWSRVRGVLFWTLYIVGFTMSGAILGVVGWSLDLQPLISIDLRPFASSDNAIARGAGLAVVALLPMLVYDLLYYWFHRLQHAVPLLWRIHQVHHSYEELNVANSAHHPLEDIIALPFTVVPLVFLVELRSLEELAFVGSMFAIWVAFNHTSARVERWPLKWLLTWPHYHRVHHSIAPEHRNKNFAVVFPFWDWLFGTRYVPRPGETIRTGVPDRHGPRTLREYLFGLTPRGDA